MEKLYAMTILLNIATCKLSNVDLLIFAVCFFVCLEQLLTVNFEIQISGFILQKIELPRALFN